MPPFIEFPYYGGLDASSESQVVWSRHARRGAMRNRISHKGPRTYHGRPGMYKNRLTKMRPGVRYRFAGKPRWTLPLICSADSGRKAMGSKIALVLVGLFAITTCAQQTKTVATAPNAPAEAPSQQPGESSLPYTPSLDPAAMDRTVDPCVDFYEYSCGGWKKMNPIPPDQTSWSVYHKLYEDNLNYLRGILEEASTGANRDVVTQEIGDYYASCMAETSVEKLGAAPL